MQSVTPATAEAIYALFCQAIAASSCHLCLRRPLIGDETRGSTKSSMKYVENPDVVVIGSGIMSANLSAMLKRLEPKLSIQVYEVTDALAQESSDGWSNAGTGHAGICELSYTPHRAADGSVNVAKAIEIFEQFEQSKQFWAYAVASGMIEQPGDFIRTVPHMSFVHGQAQVDFLKARHAAMSAHPFFAKMEFSTDRATIARWAPLLVDGRDPHTPIAATWMENGTDVNFGEVARKLLGWLGKQDGCAIAAGHRVIGLDREGAGWRVTARNLATGETQTCHTKFVFVGAGGGSLTLLQKSGIPEARGLAGFPIGGQWLVCNNPRLVEQHLAKVYGQALDAAPTMAVPHLDSRVLNGERKLLFGPFAAWTTKFLQKKGSFTDLPFSIRPGNLLTLIKVGLSNFDLVRYLVSQGLQSMEARMQLLRIFYPGAQRSDWDLVDAGIRVQAIKKTDGEAGIVHYGTEIISSADHTISALLGASPGASVSVNIVFEVIKKCLPHLLESNEQRARLKAMLPAWDEDLKDPKNAQRYEQVAVQADEALQLKK